MLLRDILEHVEGDRVLGIGRIEQDDIVRPTFRNIGDERIRQVSMRIDEGDSSSFADVFVDHILQQDRLSHSGLSDDVYMPGPIHGEDSEIMALSSEIRASDRRSLMMLVEQREILRRFENLRGDPADSRGLDVERRKMHES